MPKELVYYSLSMLLELLRAFAFYFGMTKSFNFEVWAGCLVRCQGLREILLFLFKVPFELFIVHFENSVLYSSHYLLCLILYLILSSLLLACIIFCTYLGIQSEHQCQGLRISNLDHHWNRFLCNWLIHYLHFLRYLHYLDHNHLHLHTNHSYHYHQQHFFNHCNVNFNCFQKYYLS